MGDDSEERGIDCLEGFFSIRPLDYSLDKLSWPAVFRWTRPSLLLCLLKK